MLTNTRKELAGPQHGRISVVLATALVTVGVGAMALTFTPTGFPPKVALDHSVLDNPDLLPASNPAPLAVAAYD
ncbi:MAG: hypothetical protein WCH60_19565 [Burkholderiales bacterium]